MKRTYLLFLCGLAGFAPAPAATAQEPEMPAFMTLPDGRVLPTRDRRAWAADPADDLPAAVQQELDQRFAASVLGRAPATGLTAEAASRLQSLAQRAQAVPVPPPPGGVGYGFFFTEGTLPWTNSSASYQSMIAPRTPGGDVTNFLYSTTTNRTNLGVEAFISYFAQTDFHFKVFDWARYPSAPWQTDIVYGNLGEYISSLQNGDGTWRQELFVVNETFSTSTNHWTNRVWLENRVDDVMDMVYSFNYTTTSVTQNTYQTGDYFGSWAPIFETFQDHNGSNTPIGWNDFWLVQDGVTRAIAPGNSYARNDDPDLFPPIFLTPNHAWAVGSTSGEPGVTGREAETGQHRIGQLNGDGWLAGPAHGTGLMYYGPSFNNVPGGRMNAEFRFKVDSLSGPGGILASYGVYDVNTATVVAQADLFLSQFNAAGDYDPFRMDFTAVAGHSYRLAVRSYGLVNVTLDRVALVKN